MLCAIYTTISPYAYSFTSHIYLHISDNARYFIHITALARKQFHVETKTKSMKQEKLFRVALTTLDFAITGNTLNTKEPCFRHMSSVVKLVILINMKINHPIS